MNCLNILYISVFQRQIVEYLFEYLFIRKLYKSSTSLVRAINHLEILFNEHYVTFGFKAYIVLKNPRFKQLRI